MARIITDEMYASIPALIDSGKRKLEIAALFGCLPSTLVVQCCRRGISLRKGGSIKHVRLSLPTAELPLSEAVLKIIRETARDMGKDPAQLAGDLLEKIAFDDLFKAVLDTEDA